ncbi:MAG: YggS family pyridoxal phosphate-dependent enzyme [Gammaproteobacteria bacterium]|nr:YggS family pyridoxal phosphate-dependent enzyme [Gammaproteobacteria bacterium]
MPCDLNSPTGLRERLARVEERIARAERQYGREPGGVRLIAASKAQTSESIKAAVECGQRAFGENYLQEAASKIEQLDGLAAELSWHYIGPLQANKTGRIASLFEWVHSVDRARVATRLSAQRPTELGPLNICLQVNIDREPAKAGVLADHLPALAEHVATLQNLSLRGLMAIPAATYDFDRQRKSFAALRAALEDLNRRGHDVAELSMGMSADLEAAIAEGATMVRVGTAIFGRRSSARG